LTAVAQGQIVNIPNTLLKDALTNNACVDLNSDGIGDADADTDNDGEIQVSEAEAVNGLYLGILLSGSMTGLEAFINLQNLQLSFISFTGVLDFTVLPQLKIPRLCRNLCVRNQCYRSYPTRNTCMQRLLIGKFGCIHLNKPQKIKLRGQQPDNARRDRIK